MVDFVTFPNWPKKRSIFFHKLWCSLGFSDGASGKEPTCQCRRHKRRGFDPWIGKTPWRRAWQPIPVFLLGESHGQTSWQLQCMGSQSQTWLKWLGKAHKALEYAFITPSPTTTNQVIFDASGPWVVSLRNCLRLIVKFNFTQGIYTYLNHIRNTKYLELPMNNSNLNVIFPHKNLFAIIFKIIKKYNRLGYNRRIPECITCSKYGFVKVLIQSHIIHHITR